MIIEKLPNGERTKDMKKSSREKKDLIMNLPEGMRRASQNRFLSRLQKIRFRKLIVKLYSKK